MGTFNTDLSKSDGFTLVELSIVMIVIGLLIGGVLKGQELIKNARITSVISQVKQTHVAYATFWDSYRAIPGDMRNATSLIQGCNAGISCVNGDGNNRVWTGTWDSWTSQPWMNTPADINSENVQFWKHLALMDLISGVRESATTVGWGETHPVTSFGSGFHARSSLAPVGHGKMTGVTIVLRNNISGDWQCGGVGGADTCAMSPQDAERIDRKMDDGNAVDGAVQAISGNWDSGCGRVDGPNNGPQGYNTANSTASCDMMFKISNQQ